MMRKAWNAFCSWQFATVCWLLIIWQVATEEKVGPITAVGMLVAAFWRGAVDAFRVVGGLLYLIIQEGL